MKRFLKVSLATLFILSLLTTLLCTAVFFSFRIQSVQSALRRQGFYDRAMSELQNTVLNMQSIVNVETSAVLDVIAKEDVSTQMQAYTNEISRHLLENTTDTVELSFSSDALYQVVCDTITPAQYNGNTAALEADRKDAYADLQTAITDTLAFFPQSLYTTLKELASKYSVPLDTVYTHITYMRRLPLPFFILTLLSGAALFWCYRCQKSHGLRIVAGCAFITTSPLFLCGVFLRATPFTQRLSLADGLLKDYMYALVNSMGNSAFAVLATAFFLSFFALVAAIVWQVFSPKTNTCNTP